MPGQSGGNSRRGGLGTRVSTCGLAVLLMLSTAARAQTYTNPISTPAFPAAGPSVNGPADPVVVDFEGRYYTLPTNSGVTYKAMWSEDLVNWQGDQTAFSINSGSPWKWTGLWAPEIERVNGRFYLYYTAGAGDFPDQHIGVAEALNPAGPYADRSYDAPLIMSSIDAELFIDDDGQLYLYHVRNVTNPWSLSIWGRKMSDPLTLDPDSAAVMCIRPQEWWEASVTEGPTIIKREGKYYMFYSAWGAISANYVVGVATADNPLGPWTRQTGAFNPIIKRNDGDGFYGPGHGDYVTGPDGIGEWYFHHLKLYPEDNWKRQLALTRLVSTGREDSFGRRYTSSGGVNGPTASPRLPFESSTFQSTTMPSSFHTIAGKWEAKLGKLYGSYNAKLLIERALLPQNRQHFLFEWWLKADGDYVETLQSKTEFLFDVTRDGEAYQAGFQLLPGFNAVRFIEVDANGAVQRLGQGQLAPTIDWTAYSHKLRMTKWLDTWTLEMDGQPLLSADYAADVGWAAWVQTCQMPVVLDGYRQTVAFVDRFESGDSAAHWTPVTGSWSFVAPTTLDDGYLLQDDESDSGWKIALGSKLALDQFDLSADFRLINQVTGSSRYPKHGLVHNYVDDQNYAMVFIDDQYDVLATNARINGSSQTWINSPLAMPDTFSIDDYRHLAVTTDATTGEFVYSLNGHEMLRRSYAGLPTSGRAGVISELSQIKVDNFRFSGTTETADIDGDGEIDAADNCPWDANPNQDDADNDGVGDVCDRCPATVANARVDALGCRPVATGDTDFDGDLDADDVAVLADCFSGPGETPSPANPSISAEDCLFFFDHDGDQDLDLVDFGGVTAYRSSCGGL